jgi:hypothetical protein
MSYFKLDEYQTVQERIDLFWEKYPQGRLSADLIFHSESQFIVRTEVFLDKNDTHPATVDFAEERVGSSNVNKTSALENCVTSSYGRSIADLGGIFSPKGKKPSREEMQKVERNAIDYLSKANAESDIDKLREIYKDARSKNVSDDVLKKIEARVNGLKQSSSK